MAKGRGQPPLTLFARKIMKAPRNVFSAYTFVAVDISPVLAKMKFFLAFLCYFLQISFSPDDSSIIFWPRAQKQSGADLRAV